ncbi:tetratricopeptide repeat protein [Streptomyces decoyicus]|uniref:tetratricopeptide repeat protein n=1 Tax=Streptomyces decoyicus TaxID=249567 RepID=UPI00069F9CBF|nr:tetratricopeptide repeat protein [Streptomyces decoyicus]KOG44281.1 tetratricopeptide repeat protein 38 [Streptomyces decoyicus]QZY14051.1 tetratricopeptide repeat protein [Streptomyces decoyicus]
MTADRHGHLMSGTGAEALTHYEQALDDLLFFRPQVAETAQSVLAASPRSVMGQTLVAYLGVLGTEEKDAAEAREHFVCFRSALDADGLTPRERMHLSAATAWLDGDLHGAGRILGDLTIAFPRDALALFAGHQHDFLTGDAQRLRDRVGGALHAWDEDDPHHGPLLGMYAFGLEESGHYERAEEVGLAALGQHPGDVWGIHGVVHTYEMRGRFTDGIRFLDARTDDWAHGSLLTVHNWWHYALYTLELGDVAGVLEIYDSALHHEGSAGVAMELLDAAALLWRLYLAEDEQSARWARLADAWESRQDGPHYAFNDAHAVMAYVGAGRVAQAQRLVRDREGWVAAEPGVSNHGMTAEIGLPVCRALIAYGQQDYGRAVDLLLPVRHRLHSFGGSHAQRDAIQRTLVEAAIRADRADLARTLLSERIQLRPVCPYNWSAMSRLEERHGDPARAAAARERAAAQASV